MENTSLINKIIDKNKNSYGLDFVKYVKEISYILSKTKVSYDFNSGLNEDLNKIFTYSRIIDEYIVEKSINDIKVQEMLYKRLGTYLDLIPKINSKFKIGDIDYYKEFAIIKALETFDQTKEISLPLYTVSWFIELINKDSNEDSKSLSKHIY